MSSIYSNVTSEQLKIQLENNLNSLRNMFYNESKNAQSIGWQIIDCLETLSERVSRIEETGIVERLKKAESFK